MKRGMTIEHLKCRKDLNFEVDFRVNDVIGTIVTEWNVNLFGIFREGLRFFQKGLRIFREGLRFFQEELRFIREGLRFFKEGVEIFSVGLRNFIGG